MQNLGTTDQDGKTKIYRWSENESLVIYAQDNERKLRGKKEISDIHAGMQVEFIVNNFETTTISGRVIDEDENPITGTGIFLRAKQFDGYATNITTNGSGNFIIPNLIVGDVYIISPNHPAYGTQNGENEFTIKKNMKLPDFILTE